MRLLVTGGAGFIGANFVHYTLRERSDHSITVLDALTYAGNEASLAPVRERIEFVHGSVADAALVDRLVSRCDVVVHFAAESHNDNSLADPSPFLHTNIVGTLHAAGGRAQARRPAAPHLHRRGVRGPGAGRPGEVHARDPVQPLQSLLGHQGILDLLVRAWVRSFGVTATISNCSNNYGPYQHVEKFIPRQITNILSGLRPKLYGAGANVRDWIHVDDHNSAVHAIIERGRSGRPT